MYINIERAEISITGEEISEIFYALVGNLRSAIERHWVHHPDAFEGNTRLSLDLIHALAGYAGRNSDKVIEELKSHLKNEVAAKAEKKNTGSVN